MYDPGGRYFLNNKEVACMTDCLKDINVAMWGIFFAYVTQIMIIMIFIGLFLLYTILLWQNSHDNCYVVLVTGYITLVAICVATMADKYLYCLNDKYIAYVASNTSLALWMSFGVQHIIHMFV